MVLGRKARIGAMIVGGVLTSAALFISGAQYRAWVDSTRKKADDSPLRQKYALSLEQLKVAENAIKNLSNYSSFADEQIAAASNRYNEVANSNRTLAARLDSTGRPDSEVVAETEARLKTQYDSQLRAVNGQLEDVTQSNKTLTNRLKEKDAEVARYVSSNGVAQSQSMGSEEGEKIYTIFSGVKIQFPFAYAPVIRTTNQTVLGKSESVSLGDIHVVEYMPQNGASVIDTRSDAESLVNAFQFYSPAIVNPNKFEELAIVNGGDVNFARKLEGDSDKYDRFAQFYSGYCGVQNKTDLPGVSRFKNKNGKEYVAGPVESIRSLRTGSRGK